MKSPDWAAIGRPVAALLDTVTLQHPQPQTGRRAGPPAGLADIERVIRTCGAHLLHSFRNNGFIPTFAAFNLIGDPDLRGRDFLAALTGLDARGYKNSTLLFNLARVFIARSPARELINPPWTGIAEPMWEPVQIRHRSAYYDAFFTEALLSFAETGLATPAETEAIRRASTEMVDFCLKTSREDVFSRDGNRVSVITALAPNPHPRFSRFFAQIKQDLGFGIYVPDCDTTACSFSAATQAGSTDPILDQPLLDFYAGYQVGSGANEPLVTVPLNDNIDYDGGIVTWIDNLAGDRPLRQRSRSHPQPRRSRSQLPQLFAMARSRNAAAAADRAADHRLSKTAGGERRVPRSPIPYLLSAGALLRLFRTLLRGVCGAAACRPSGDRSRRQLRLHPQPGSGVCAGHADHRRDERVRCGAGADRAGPSRRGSGDLYAGAELHRQPRSAKADGADRSRPMNGTR